VTGGAGSAPLGDAAQLGARRLDAAALLRALGEGALSAADVREATAAARKRVREQQQP
jgi:hypothetical protein